MWENSAANCKMLKSEKKKVISWTDLGKLGQR